MDNRGVPRRGLAVALLVFCGSALESKAQSIFTAAGGGTTDGKQATSIGLFGISGLAVDANGNLYISESQRHVVQRVNLLTGTIEVFAGNGGGSFSGDGGPARRASLKNPRGITFDDAGNLYIADLDNNRVRKVDAQTGIITTFAGSDAEPPNDGDGGQATAARVPSPTGLDWQGGSLYIVQNHYNASRLRRVGPDGIITTLAGTDRQAFEGDGGPALAASFNEPLGVAVDPSGNIYVADNANNRVRRIDAVTKNIETVVGGGNPADGIGDNGPGTAAKLVNPAALAFDAAGRLYIADAYNTYGRIRRWDPITKVVTTVVGNGTFGGGDGGPAAEAGLYAPFAVALDADQNLYVHDGANESVRVVGAASQVISRVAGGGSFIGDGLLATSAILRGPRGLAVDAGGNLYIADAYQTLVRRVDAATGVISTFAGILNTFYGGDDRDGKLAVEAAVGAANDVAISPAGEVFIADPHSGRVWRVDQDGRIFTYAGGGPEDGLGDNGNAVGASLSPLGISFDAAGNLYIADSHGGANRHRIRKVDAQTKIITTVAGSATGGDSGDNGPATSAQLQGPVHAVVDAAGNIYIADTDNGAVRRVDAISGQITTYAGRGTPADGIGDGLPATLAAIAPVHMAIDRATGDLYVADKGTHRVRLIDAQSKFISTVAGSGTWYLDAGYSGDNGPAKAAKLNFQYEISGVARDGQGNLYAGDTLNNRVRAVFACRQVTAPQLTLPADGSADAGTAPTLTWNAVAGAFRYDVFLDTQANPQTLVAADTDETRFTPANLAPGTKYFWKIRAKGDPFCVSSQATSAVRSFTTAAGCVVAPFGLLAPAAGAVNVDPVVLSWQAAAGAGSYDLYLGTVNPPPLFRTGLTQTSLAVTADQGTNYWRVVAHASCDATETTSSPMRSFTPKVVGCTGSAAVTLLAPAAGATDVPSGTTLTWRADGCATAPFDVYFGTDADPPLLSASVAGTTQPVTSLAPSTAYRWRVVGTRAGGARVNSATATFTTRACAAPGATAFSFGPASVAAGSSYSVVWRAADDLDPGGGYLVDRSTTADFSRVESQITFSTSASFIAERAGTYYHRVRAIPSCDPKSEGPVSEARAVAVRNAAPNVIFTVQPAAVVVDVGDSLEEVKGTFTLENIGTETVRAGVGRQELGNSAPFFSIFDPEGNDVFVTLEPRKPRTFEIRYGGPSTAVPGSYQGIIYVAGESLSVIPYAFVELRVGQAGASTPRFELNGAPTEYASLPGHAGDASMEIGIRNTGSAPMELAAEVGPDVWLVPQKGWNDGEIAPGAVRTVRLTTRRAFAPNGSPLPRYTFFTVRTKDGATARLLMQDNDPPGADGGRAIALGAADRSFVVPEVTSRDAVSGGLLVTRLRLTNAGSDAVQAELVLTPSSKDGFDATAVRRATVVVPPNDVVTLTDPLVQLMSMQRPIGGQLEVRLPQERVGLVTVSASAVALNSGATVQLPTFGRGDGARRGSAHVLHGLTENTGTTSSLVLAETSGLADATVRVTLFDRSGTRRGDAAYALSRYGYRRIDGILPALGVASDTYARLEIDVESGAGSVMAVGIVRERASEKGAAFVSVPASTGAAAANLLEAFHRRSSDPGGAEPHDNLPNVTLVVPVLGPPAPGGGVVPSYKTLLELISGGAASIFTLSFRGIDGTTLTTLPGLTVPQGLSIVFNDALQDLFGLAGVDQGSVRIDATNGGKVSAVLQSAPSPTAAPTLSSLLPLLSAFSETVTGAAAGTQRPLFFDGLEQSVDPDFGSRWLLLVNEVGGAGGTVVVRLYESGNRQVPIAEKEFAVTAYQQLTLDTVFAALGLDAPDRRKNRANVQVVVTATSGSARVAASAVSIDNRTGETQVHELVPSGFGTGISLVTPILPPQPIGRRRGVRH